METIWAVLLAAGIPSAVVGILIGRMNKKIDRRDKAREELDAARLRNQVIQMELIAASLSLGEATAEAVQRIPDAHCNGDMHSALDYAKGVKAKYRDFEREQVVKHLEGGTA
jgi:hypothetical protein